ncbi:HAD family hydrolase [Bacillus chungangensis]|uniref:FMN phosphatase YigB (HAD superfamily) n=1 Tax=Bacillus chungangensis TaxID=587633 RepID=A0ABT9WYI0_9BACI|nr:HAD family hydrolase [Bacillus chungangensis]MDQ0178341.1 FMN phosphatase YigB (HAD superfamily) [Bacillus chungangensis]
MKKWITFDLDGTFMQNPFIDHVFVEIEKTILAHCETCHAVTAALFAEHEKRMKMKNIAAAYNWDDIVHHYLSANNIACSIDVEALVQKHSKQPKVYLLENNILETLDQLVFNGFSLAVITNGFKKYQLPVMDELGLTGYFKKIVTPEKMGVGKPDPRMFAPFKGNIFAHVGDRLDHDVQAANLYGTTSILIYRRLPKQLREKSIKERNNDPLVNNIYFEKWKKETKTDSFPPSHAIPDILITSINEMLQVVKNE